MSPMMTKKLNYFLRLQYPVRIVAGEDGLIGSLPDLPGCSVVADSAPAVYAALDDARRTWLREQVAAGQEIPLPNSYLSADDADAPTPREPELYAQREATPF